MVRIIAQFISYLVTGTVTGCCGSDLETNSVKDVDLMRGSCEFHIYFSCCSSRPARMLLARCSFHIV